jgi:hypothetical protein
VKYSDEGDKPEVGSKTNGGVNEARWKSEIELAKGASGGVIGLGGRLDSRVQSWTDKIR